MHRNGGIFFMVTTFDLVASYKRLVAGMSSLLTVTAPIHQPTARIVSNCRSCIFLNEMYALSWSQVPTNWCLAIVFFPVIFTYIRLIEVLDAVFSLLHIYTQGKAAKQGNIFIYRSSIRYLLFVPKASQVPGNFFRIRAVLPIYLIPVKGQVTVGFFLPIYPIPFTRINQDHLHLAVTPIAKTEWL